LSVKTTVKSYFQGIKDSIQHDSDKFNYLLSDKNIPNSKNPELILLFVNSLLESDERSLHPLIIMKNSVSNFLVSLTENLDELNPDINPDILYN